MRTKTKIYDISAQILSRIYSYTSTHAFCEGSERYTRRDGSNQPNRICCVLCNMDVWMLVYVYIRIFFSGSGTTPIVSMLFTSNAVTFFLLPMTRRESWFYSPKVECSPSECRNKSWLDSVVSFWFASILRKNVIDSTFSDSLAFWARQIARTYFYVFSGPRNQQNFSYITNPTLEPFNALAQTAVSSYSHVSTGRNVSE